MILYKFRPLSNSQDLGRAKQILETGHFWCSKFSELNDPMEGAFTILSEAGVDSEIGSVYGEKSKYKICSFSRKGGFERPPMWGYYANGFRGVAIEVNVEDDGKIKKVEYEGKTKFIERIRNSDGSIDQMTIDRILTTKLKSWKHEEEYRFLRTSENNLHKVGKITAIYFGDPYYNFRNQPDILGGSESLREYTSLKKQLEIIARDRKSVV